MKKFLRLSALLIFIQVLQAKAQQVQPVKNSLNVSLNPGSTLKDVQFVTGVDVQLQHHLSDNFALSLSAGYTHFFGKKTDLSVAQYVAGYQGYDKANLLPFKAGVKYYLQPQLYLGAAAGIAVELNGNSSAVWAAEAGYDLNAKFSLGIKYENYTDFSPLNQLALRLAYRIL